MNCPKAFYFKTIQKRSTKNTPANTRGTLAHTALEELFKLPREERTPARAHEFIAPAWEKLQERTSYQGMVEPGSQDEQEMLDYARQMVSNAFKIERIRDFDPDAVEYHAEANLGELTLHGYIDRLDKPKLQTFDGEERFIISDWKTGSIPKDRYLEDAFFAMRIYALLLHEETGEMPYMLRLIYLKGENAQEAVRRVVVTKEMLDRTRREVENIWTKIRTSAATGNWPTKKGPLCNFCDFKAECPAWGGAAK